MPPYLAWFLILIAITSSFSESVSTYTVTMVQVTESLFSVPLPTLFSYAFFVVIIVVVFQCFVPNPMIQEHSPHGNTIALRTD